MRLKTITFFLCFIFIPMILKSFQVLAEETQPQRRYKIDELIELALEKNPSVYSALSSIDIAKGELRSAKAYPNPELDFSLARGKSREDNSSEAEFGISVVQPIEWPLKRLYRRKAAEEEIKATEFEKEAVKAELIFTTKQLYYSILIAKKDVEIARENLDTTRTLFSIIERRVELGESRELDFIKSRIETLKFERELTRAEAILNRFLGDSLERDFDGYDELTPPSFISSLDVIAQKVTDFNPQIKAQEAQISRTRFSLSEQKNLWVPDLFLQGFYEREIDKSALGGGIGISIPLWYQNQGGIQRARAEERKASFDLKLLEIEIGNSLEEEYKNYRVAFEQSKIFSEELLDRAKRSLEITQFSYEQGEIGLLDVLDTIRTYRDTLREYYQVLYEFYISQITLEKIAGGKI